MGGSGLRVSGVLGFRDSGLGASCLVFLLGLRSNSRVCSVTLIYINWFGRSIFMSLLKGGTEGDP